MSDSASPTLVLGTAGHIDHGKTRLIQALTGVDTDRLPEEKSRGITIELGFAPLDLGDDIRFGVVDVPGHEGLVRTMVAGATGIDVVLLVVAADEGAMPQTREHLAICNLLGLERGVVALTKADLADEEMLELAREDVRDVLAGTALAEAPIVPVSSVSGDGLEPLRAALRDAARDAAAQPARGGPARLWTDRCFEMRGFGPVVTGTLVGGALSVGETLAVHPTDREARVRGLQSFGETCDTVAPGSRCAVNLQGLHLDDLGRGLLLSKAGAMRTTDRFDATLEWLEGAPRLDRDPVAIELLTGTACTRARVALIGSDALEAGMRGFARVHLDGDPLALLPGDRFVVRGFARQGPTGATWGGGQIVDAAPLKQRRSDPLLLESVRRLVDADPHTAVRERLTRAGHAGVDASRLVQETGLDADAVRAELEALQREGAIDCGRGSWLGPASAAALRQRMVEALSRFHAADALAPGMPKRTLAGALADNVPEGAFEALLDALTADGTFRVDDALVRTADFAPQLTDDETALADRLRTDARAAALEPPTLRDWAAAVGGDETSLRRLLTHLVQQGDLIHTPGDFFFDRVAVDALRERVSAHLREAGELDTATYKDLIGTSRKYAVPLMELFDAEQLTVRKGEVRVLRRR